MSVGLLAALESHGNADGPRTFNFQHKLSHDFESLIWVIIYAMTIRRKNTLATTNPSKYAKYKEYLDSIWGVHSYGRLLLGHDSLVGTGCSRLRTIVEELWFPDPLEAEFFRAAMRLVRSQAQDGEPITYEKMQSLFRTYIRNEKQASVSAVPPE